MHVLLPHLEAWSLLLLLGQFFTGVAGGFGERLRDRRLQEAEDARRREDQGLSLLTQLAGNDTVQPQVRTAALSALVQSMTEPKRARGLFDKFFQVAEQSPVTGALQQLLQPTTETGLLPSRQRTGVSRLPPSASAALPAQSPVEPGSAPPQVLTPTVGRRAQAPTLELGPARQSATEVTTPPNVFVPPPSIEQEAFQRRRGTLRAEQEFPGPPPEPNFQAIGGEPLEIAGQFFRPVFNTRNPAQVSFIPIGAPAAGDQPLLSLSDNQLFAIAAGALPDAPISPAQAQQILDAKASQAPEGENVQGLAAMAVRQPDVLQGVTPTVRGQVMNAIAKDPALRQQFEQTRLAPIRSQAQTMLDAINRLVDVDARTGGARLSPGAQQLFGERTPTLARGFIPTKAATDANAALQQLVGQQIVDLIQQMKAQSQTGATGFGQLNTRELDVLTSASTQLSRRLSEPTALSELLKLRERFQKILLPSSAETGGTEITLDTPVFIGPDGRPRIGAP